MYGGGSGGGGLHGLKPLPPPPILEVFGILLFFFFSVNTIFQFKCLWISLTVSHTLIIVFYDDARGLYSGLGISKKWPILRITSHKLQSNQLQFN